jgi:transposase-like protein
LWKCHQRAARQVGSVKEFAFHPEDRARSSIDRQLAASGWLIQSKADMNLGAGLGVAVRELQTASGPVDYGLFVGRRLCGVIEAKPEGTTLSGFSEQAARYIAGIPKHLVREEGQVRFEYVASGTETLFRDHADPDPTSRRVFAFHRPDTLERWLKEPATLRARLQAMPAVVTDGLRACQIDAISALERSMASNHPRALVQMATGAGKTFTACTLSYRLLAHAGFRRILFLADRANLVRQTRDEYLAGETVDTKSATGRLILTIFAGFAQFERELMLERQREGIAKTKAEGKYKGRKPTARMKAEEAVLMCREGKSVTEVARALGIGRGSVYRAIDAADVASARASAPCSSP